MRKLAIAVVALAGTAWAGSAAAVPMTYTITGLGSGSLNGIDFSDENFTITMVGDTANLVNEGFGTNVVDPLTSASIDIDDVGDLTFSQATRMGATPTEAFFSHATNSGTDILDFHVPNPVDFATAFGPISVTNPFTSQFAGIPTSGGSLSVNFAEDLQFSSADGAPVATSGAPEPESWALMLLGFGGLGALLRARRGRRPAQAAV